MASTDHPESHAYIRSLIYAAKSTEDRRGAIATQLEDCRKAIVASGGRRIVAEYVDEAASGYNANRGPGLARAMEHAERLAEEGACVDLWVQHSDRLARGDGKRARHVVEIALWALKHEITVRPVEDTSSFESLLLACVMGQRNHEDSKRKASLVSAGYRRAAERGDYCGSCADGYRVTVDVGAGGSVHKRLEFDPERRPIIAFLFASALRGRTAHQIALALDKKGWRTNPRKRGVSPQRWDAHRVLHVLTNPRYAGLSSFKGHVVAQGHWPGYITPEEFERLRKRRLKRGHVSGRRKERLPREPYLLAQIARCGQCGATMLAASMAPRLDGSRLRAYICRNHTHSLCPAPPLNGEIVDTAFVANLPLLLARPDTQPGSEVGQAHAGQLLHQGLPAVSSMASFRQRLRLALVGADSDAADALINQLLAIQPEPLAGAMSILDGPTISTDATRGRQAQLAVFRCWAAEILTSRADALEGPTRQLRQQVASWFRRVLIDLSDGQLTVIADPRPSVSVPDQQLKDLGQRSSVSVDYDSWREHLRHVAGRDRRTGEAWSKPEILRAITRWADEHGQPPALHEWTRSTGGHPASHTVNQHFGNWSSGLRAAGLIPRTGQENRPLRKPPFAGKTPTASPADARRAAQRRALSVPEVAWVLRIPEPRVYKLIETGRLAPTRPRTRDLFFGVEQFAARLDPERSALAQLLAAGVLRVHRHSANAAIDRFIADKTTASVSGTHLRDLLEALIRGGKRDKTPKPWVSAAQLGHALRLGGWQAWRPGKGPLFYPGIALRARGEPLARERFRLLEHERRLTRDVAVLRSLLLQRDLVAVVAAPTPARFLDEMTEPDKRAELPLSVLNEAFADWGRRQGMPVPSGNALALELWRRGCVGGRTTSVARRALWRGVRLRPEQSAGASVG